MKKPIQLGITGGIGSGKSLISRIFGCMNVPLYDADSRAKALMTTDGILINQIKKEFGNLSYHKDGSLNREYLRKVFGEPKELLKLNALVHPRVAVDYSGWVDQQIGHPLVIKEAALLIESGSAKNLDQLLVVYAPKTLRMSRILKRDPQRTQTEIENIMKNQLNEEEKMKQADFVIVNDETQLVIPQVLELHERLLSMN